MRNELAENFVDKVVAEKYWEFYIDIDKLQNDIMEGVSLAIEQFTKDDVTKANGAPRKVKVNFTNDGVNTGYYMISSAPIEWVKDDVYEGDWYTPMHMGSARVGIKMEFPMILIIDNDGFDLRAMVPYAVFMGATTFSMDAGATIAWHSDLWTGSGQPQ